jgi:hypothetical protein
LPEQPLPHPSKRANHHRDRAVALLLAGALLPLVLNATDPVLAQQAMTLNGPPVQVQPYVSEPGVPLITVSPGTPNPFAGADGDGTATGTGTGAGDGGTSGGTVGDSTALSTMMGTDWGSTAIANAQSVGVNPSALAATCVLESGCQNVSTSGAQGVFQMYPAAFNEGLQTALAANPALASQIVQGSAGMNDPTTEAIAASGYLMQAAQSLQSAGISDPSVLQARGYYNFGPSNGIALASADANQTMAAAMPNVSAATLAANGISAGETVAQWQASVATKIGTAANQSVLGV